MGIKFNRRVWRVFGQDWCDLMPTRYVGEHIFNDRFIRELCEEKEGGLIGSNIQKFSMVLQYDDMPDDGMLKQNASLVQRPLAKTMIVFMFKGLFTNTALCYTQFAVSSLMSADLLPLLWKTIERLTHWVLHTRGFQ